MQPRPRGELMRQAAVVRSLGSPFVAAILETGDRQLPRAPRTAALIASWPGDPAAAALAMRFNAALHALARRKPSTALGSLYRRRHDDFDGAIGAVLAAEDDFIHEWMRTPPQTNEVGRAAALAAALMVARQAIDMPVDLLELGSSAGLNLNLARYSYDLGGLQAGTPASRVRIAPAWRGSPPPDAPIEVVAARGVDLAPLDAADAATRERLLAYVFADQPCRSERLEQALAIAQRHPPLIDRGEAATWLRDRLAIQQPAGCCRVVFHSMVMQYLDGPDRQTVLGTLTAAGARATAARPLAWISFEWTPERTEVQLRLTCWPDGKSRILATCHPYGAAIAWHALRGG